jgi:DNA invertase Pin-like site-specific DNA recombinase
MSSCHLLKAKAEWLLERSLVKLNLSGNRLTPVWLDYDGIGTFPETDIMRAALYLRISTTDGQTTENQRMALAKVAEHRGWGIVQSYEDAGISGAKGRDQRPAFNRLLKDAVRRRFDVLMIWSIDRLGRSVLHVSTAMAEMDVAGVALYSDQQAIDSTSPFGKAMIQMACVFGELEREMLRARVVAGLADNHDWAQYDPALT